MKNIRLQIENSFSKLGLWTFNNRLKTIFFMLLMTLGLASQLPNLVIDTRNEAFFLESDYTLVTYNEFKEQFGKDESFIIAIEPPEVFDAAFLAQLKKFHEELENTVPYIDEITSLINARHTYGKDDELIVDDLLAELPDTKTEMDALRETVLSNPFYKNMLISTDGRLTAILIKPLVSVVEGAEDVLGGFDEEAPTANPQNEKHLSNPEFTEMAAAIREIAQKYQTEDVKINIAGMPAFVDTLDREIQENMPKLSGIVYLLTLLFLYLMFRRISGVLYPILIVTLGTVATISTLPLLGASLNNLSLMIPTFIMVVGIADAVHILAVFYRHYNKSGNKKEAIGYAMGHSALAILMTSLTTAGGLMSFIVADVRPVAEFGMVTPIGIMLVFAYTIILLPALISLFPLAKINQKVGKREVVMDRFLAGIGSFSCRNAVPILIVTFILATGSLISAAQLHFSHNAMTWLSPGNAVRVATELVDDRLEGSVPLEIVLDTKTKNGLHDPKFLEQLSQSVIFLESFKDDPVIAIGKAWTVDSIIKETHRALNENRQSHYVIPQDRNLVAQEFLLFEGSGSDDLEKMIDRDFSKVRLTIKAAFRDAFEFQPLLAEVKNHFENTYPEAEITVTGEMSLIVKMLVNVLTSLAKSYAISLTVITLLMVLLIGRVRIGLMSMIPNLIPLLLVGGMMGAFNIPLDFSTIMTGSVAIGLVVDDTIHFMHNFRRYFEEYGDVEKAVQQTLLTAGRAVMITSIVLAVGFFTYLSADMQNLVYFGMITGSAVVLGLLSDFFLTPALMTFVFRKTSQTKNAHLVEEAQ